MAPNYNPRAFGKSPQESSRSDPQQQGRSTDHLPKVCIIRDSFYVDKKNKCLKEEIFLNAAEEAAKTFAGGRRAMTQSSLRAMFNMLKAMDNRIKVERDIPIARIKEEYLKFHRWCIYQERREVIPYTFLQFAEEHLEVATRDADEFHGFVEYLTSIMARMKSK